MNARFCMLLPYFLYIFDNEAGLNKLFTGILLVKILLVSLGCEMD